MSVEPPHPSETYTLEGHGAAEKTLAEAIASGRMHHAWMLSGPSGIGKATLAWRAARRLLGAAADISGAPLGAEPDDPVCQRMLAGAHSDLLVLERPMDARGGLKAQIPVEAARGVAKFFATTAGEGGWRVCIVDAADELNTQAANALLKTLEEPPPRCVFLLTAHARGRVPVTVRSRCRLLRLSAPGVEAAARVARALAEVDADAAKAAAELTKGRPGLAARWAAAGGPELARTLQGVWTGADSGAAMRLVERLGARDGQTLRGLFFHLARDHVLSAARETPGAAGVWGAAWDGLNQLEDELGRLHMDAAATMTEALRRMEQARRAAQAL